MKQRVTLRKNTEKGFAMLFAVLTSSVLLSIGLSIFGLTIRELELSSTVRESQFAFYAADTGVECALYWDTQENAFATSSDTDTGTLPPIECANNSAVTEDFEADPNAATTTFSLTMPVTGDDRCVVVTVSKWAAFGGVLTAIGSRGYNTCDDTDPNRIERAIRVTY